MQAQVQQYESLVQLGYPVAEACRLSGFDAARAAHYEGLLRLGYAKHEAARLAVLP